jgi:hypothetical protein
MLRRWWAEHRALLLGLAIALMATLALLKLGYEFRRLVWELDPGDALDLKSRYAQVHRWFASRRVSGFSYPPASYVLLWPFLGWLPLAAVRWLWAGTALVALGWLAYISAREGGATRRTEWLFLALFPLALNATGSAVGEGQMTIQVLAAFVGGVILLRRGPPGWRTDLLATALLLAALAKPTLSVPLFWVVFFALGRPRVGLLVAVGYVCLTLWAASFQSLSPLGVVRTSDSNLSMVEHRGYANVLTWLSDAGLQAWIRPAMLLILAAAGLWTWRYRHADIWILLGVGALVARLWTYHLVYDDVLILFPMIALFRIAKREATTWYGLGAAALLAVTLVSMLLPGRLLQLEPPWGTFFQTSRATLWLVQLAFLHLCIRRQEPVARR